MLSRQLPKPRGQADDVYALLQPAGAQRVLRAAFPTADYFQHAPYRGCRSTAVWPEDVLAKVNGLRIRLRGRKGGMCFVDRRKVYLDPLAGRNRLGLDHDYRASI